MHLCSVCKYFVHKIKICEHIPQMVFRVSNGLRGVAAFCLSHSSGKVTLCVCDPQCGLAPEQGIETLKLILKHVT